MIAISLSKLIFTIFVIVVVWRAFKVLGPLFARMQGAAPRQQSRASGQPQYSGVRAAAA